MKTDRELIQQALKMIRSLRYRSLTDVSDEIISALEERLAQPEQEHVLQEIEQYRMQMAGISTAAIGYWKEGDDIHPEYDTIALRDVAKLYAKYDVLYKAQPEQSVAGYCKKIEELIAERDSLRAALAQPEQEPVAWMVIGDGEYGEYTPGMHFDTVGYKEYWERRGYELQPLYTTPPQRKPLTDGAEAVITAARAAMDASTEAQDGEGGIKIASDLAASLSLCLDEYDRAIKAAHGIKE